MKGKIIKFISGTEMIGSDYSDIIKPIDGLLEDLHFRTVILLHMNHIYLVLYNKKSDKGNRGFGIDQQGLVIIKFWYFIMIWKSKEKLETVRFQAFFKGQSMAFYSTDRPGCFVNILKQIEQYIHYSVTIPVSSYNDYFFTVSSSWQTVISKTVISNKQNYNVIFYYFVPYFRTYFLIVCYLFKILRTTVHMQRLTAQEAGTRRQLFFAVWL